MDIFKEKLLNEYQNEYSTMNRLFVFQELNLLNESYTLPLAKNTIL